MSRIGAGFGSAVGASIGYIVSPWVSDLVPPQPGYTPEDDKSLEFAVRASLVLIGGAVGAALLTGPGEPAPAKQIGTSSPFLNPRFP